MAEPAGSVRTFPRMRARFRRVPLDARVSFRQIPSGVVVRGRQRTIASNRPQKKLCGGIRWSPYLVFKERACPEHDRLRYFFDAHRPGFVAGNRSSEASAIRDALSLCLQADTLLEDQCIAGSTAHSGLRASIVVLPRYPRVARTAPRDLEGYGFQDNRAFRGWDMRSALPLDNPVASDSNDLPAILHPCSPVIMA